MLFFLCLAAALPAAAAPVPRSVLILHQWEANRPWYAAFFSAFTGVIRSGSPEPITIFAEHLDLGRFKEATHQENLHRYLMQKYPDRDIGVIVAVGSQALDFALGIRAEMWPEAPVVFAAASESAVGELNLAAGITGSVIEPSLREMVATARALVPGLEEIVLLGDSWDASSPYQSFTDELPAIAAGLQAIDLTGLALPEIRRRVAVLHEKSAILYTPIFVDGAGVAFLPGDALESIAEVANRPIIVDAQSEVGNGATGGVLFNPDAIGTDAARRVLRIMRGDTASNIPLSRGEFTKAVFDGRQLQRFGVDDKALPPGSDIRFRESGLWEQYRLQLSAVALIAIIQTALVGGLMMERRRRTSAELESRRHLEEVTHLNRSAAVGVLSASLGHELNQPLGAMLSNAEAAEVLLNADPPDVEKVKAILADIRRDDQRAAEVIRRLRALMKKSKPEPQLIDVNDVVRVMTDILGAEAASRGVVLSADLDQRPLPARADPVHLQQVVLNLALNGMDAMLSQTAGGRFMTVTTALIDSSVIKVSVSDSGTGIPPDKVKDIFEPFFTTKRQGMGLGLSIARTLIEQSGGKIWAENRPEGGAIFSFTLPVVREKLP